MKPPSIESDSVPRIGDLIGGKFRITETLGQGGMGVVLGGEHLDLRQLVAIKVLRPALAKEPDALARFLREARAAASIKSRHAVRIYDVGTIDSGVPYIVMERLHGISVDALLEDKGKLPVEQAVQIVVEAAEAVAEANGLGIVHRDVKPSNLYLANDVSGVPIVKVLDFGISKRVTADEGDESASLTAPQTLLGSPQYMSPEQLRDPRSVDERTDVWGLGVTLYELLTGRMPFECESIPELCALIFNSTPARAETLRPEIPASLSDVIEGCLAKRPEARTPSVSALVAKLVPFCRGEVRALAEQLARTEPDASADLLRTRSAPKPHRSHRGSVVLGAAAATVVLGVALVLRARGEGGEGTSTRTSELSPSAVTTPRNAAVVVSDPAPAEPSATGAIAPVAPVAPVAPALAEDASVATPPSTSTRPRPTGASSLPPAAAPRASGLKGIKLMD